LTARGSENQWGLPIPLTEIGRELRSDQVCIAPLSAETLIDVAQLSVPLGSRIPALLEESSQMINQESKRPPFDGQRKENQ
jgi:hypothetical protein